MGQQPSKITEHVLETPKGKVRGICVADLKGNHVDYRYTKIPYAKPPTGDLRFRAPQPLPDDQQFSGDHSTFGPICPQPIYNTGAALVDPPPANAAPEEEHDQSEDCLYLNIWVPAGQAPSSGWPVQFHIHGGWLQVGAANQGNDTKPFDLFNVEGSTKRIIVSPTYRLNLFGFLAGKQLKEAGEQAYNFGLLDQRCALEWTHKNISLFNGNPDLITVGGLSAGAHSAFLQLYHDTYLPASQRIIKQGYFWSNAIAIQPNPCDSSVLTNQFDELCRAVDIDTSQSAKEKLSKLRSVTSSDLIDALSRLTYHTFRTSTDNSFVPADFLKTIHDGSFATRLAQNKTRIIIGEVRDEGQLYKLINPPSNFDSLRSQIANYYPAAVTDRLLSLTEIYNIPDKHSTDKEAFQDTFAEITSDMQVHCSIRGLTRSLLSPPSGTALPKSSLLRYRIEHRAQCLDKWIKPSVGVCHAADTPIWWLTGRRCGYTDKDTQDVLNFLRPFGDFLEGKQDALGDGGEIDRIDRVFKADGTIEENVQDPLWKKGMAVWDAVYEVQKS